MAPSTVLLAGGNISQQLQLVSGSEIRPEPVDWIWSGYLAAGKLHVLAGAPGTGKTTIALALAATLTAGGRWPDGTVAAPGNVVIWSGEDDMRDTLAPRLIAMGAIMSQVHFVGGVTAHDGERGFDPSTDHSMLSEAIARIGNVCLLIVDPVVSAVAADSHKNTEVRRALQPLVDLAARIGCAVLGISHFSKGTSGRDPVERVTGSIAFGALPRIVLAAAKIEGADIDSGQQDRLFARAKSNIGPDGGGFNYSLEQVEVEGYPGVFTSRLLWGNSVQGSARELLAVADAPTDSEARSELETAAEWLKNELHSGPISSKQIETDAKAAGLAWSTVRRAQNRLHIKPHKAGMSSGWLWGLPEDAQFTPKMPTKMEGASSEEMSTFGAEVVPKDWTAGSL